MKYFRTVAYQFIFIERQKLKEKEKQRDNWEERTSVRKKMKRERKQFISSLDAANLNALRLQRRRERKIERKRLRERQSE